MRPKSYNGEFGKCLSAIKENEELKKLKWGGGEQGLRIDIVSELI